MNATPLAAKTITFTIERNTRFASYKGRYNCEVFVNGHFWADAQGDTASEAKRGAENRVRLAERAGRLVRVSR